MISTNFPDVHSIEAHIGKEVGVSEWMMMQQERIHQFADATDDHQWIHVDPLRAEKESPYHSTVAHGFLTLSLIPKFLDECLIRSWSTLELNYGLNKVRFITPVKPGDRIRALIVLQSLETLENGVQTVWHITLEIENHPKPACVAEMITRWYC